MFEIARSELMQILRNRLVLLTGLIIPVAFGAYVVYQHESLSKIGGLGYIAAIVMFAVMALGLYTTAVTTLASRRQDLFLKRLRSTAASDRDILAGLLLPLTALALIQVGAILTVLGVVAAAPVQIGARDDADGRGRLAAPQQRAGDHHVLEGMGRLVRRRRLRQGARCGCRGGHGGGAGAPAQHQDARPAFGPDEA